LVVKADVALNNNPTSADILIWRGIIKSSFAGVKGGLGALSLIKESKQDLEKALDINDKALSGSAYTSLGVLYFKAPGWPISFGDDKEAEKLLQTALQINQDGIDSNFFYAEFLRDQGDLVNAKVYLEKAKRAPARSNRPVADKGRQEDIAKALLEVKDALN
jgi:tetratricopeptide (TPR) repeat protein